MRPIKSSVQAVDRLTKESFFSALKKHLVVMKNSSLIPDPMIFGAVKIRKSEYVRSLEQILEQDENWVSWINENFDFYEVYGKDKWGEALATGYYEPSVSGSLVKTEVFSRPIYSMPRDLVSADLSQFSSKFPFWYKMITIQGRIVNQKLVPYYSRQEIDTEQKLQEQKLELSWVKPLDAFFIQIQGSGVIVLPNGEKMRVGYAGQNGHNYVPVGKFLTHAIPMESMSMQKIRLYLESLSIQEQQEVLNKNPSYVFFKKLDGGALAYTGIEVTAGRSIATDLAFFPKGALAFLDIDEPQFNSSADIEPSSWIKTPRFVLDQDIGGAIKGGGRLDLYFGQGEEAAQKAGVMKQISKLYYLLPKLN